MQAIRARKVIGYLILPGIIPRARELGTSGFRYLAFLIASVYNMVRILPDHHPYLNPANIGRYGVRHVIAAAADNIAFRKENIDQIVIFIASLAAFALLAFQLAALLISLLVRPAAAFAGPFLGFFATPNPENDIAFNLMDRVFGVPDFFCNPGGACTAVQAQIPWPFHVALHTLFEFYSLAILLFAVLILLYYIVLVVGETAQTGTPFGKRFSHVWAPLRLVVAIGLLVPINYGLNSGQYITLAAAKYGSSLATNGWILFNESLADTMDRPQPVGEPTERLVALPNAPDVQGLLGFMAVVDTCRIGYQLLYNKTIIPYLVKTDIGGAFAQQVGVGSGFQAAVDFYKNGNVLVRFGEYGPPNGPAGREEYRNETGYVKPYCGEIVLHLTDFNQQPGSWQIQERYYQIVMELWEDQNLLDFGRRMVWADDFQPTTNPCGVVLNPGDNPDCNKPPTAAWRQAQLNNLQATVEADMMTAWENLRTTGEFEIDPEILDRGWGGAGIWYNKIAQYNGAFMSAVHDLPSPSKYPSVMEEIKKQKQRNDSDFSGIEMFNPHMSGEEELKYPRGPDQRMGRIFYGTMQYFMEDGGNLLSNQNHADDNMIYTAMTKLFGVYGLMNIRRNENQMVHPLAQLVAVGKGLIDSAIFNLGGAMAFAGASGIFEATGKQDGASALYALSSMFLSIMMIGLTAGFVLYYIIPFLPFIYFYFAVGGWVKSVFEAMVGVPLWALAHLRIDGNGLPGEQAANGYFLIFEIFVRPILCVFGLLGAMAIFAAQARVLHDIFNLVVLNLTGYSEDTAAPAVAGIEYDRGVIDEFFFTIVYTMILYMMATASFKLIDLIPNYIMRWMGSGVSAFGDVRDDPSQGLIRYAAIGGATVGNQVGQAAQGLGRLAGQGIGTAASAVMGGSAKPKASVGGTTKPPT